MIVVWRILDRCNLSCPFCAFDKRLVFERSQTSPETVLSFAEALSDYQGLTNNKVLISWLGGEPFLWAPLEKLTLEVRRMGLEVSATTNGTTLGSPASRRHIYENYSELTISIDGFPELHDVMRHWPGGFEKLRQSVTLLAREARAAGSRLRIRANVVLMHQNIEGFSRLGEEIAAWGISEISFNQLGGRDRPEFYPEHRLTMRDVELLETQLKHIRSVLADKNVTIIGGHKYLERIFSSARGEPYPVEDCSPGAQFLFIDEHNRIAPCSFTAGDYGLTTDHVRNGKDIVALSARFRQRRLSNWHPACADCLSTQVCDKFRRNEIKAVHSAR